MLKKTRSRREIGATLGLVAICILVIAVIGIAAYLLSKMMGGGREVANATDAGSLNLAKNAIRNPSKDALKDFPNNPDVGWNFALLGDNGSTKLNLLVYNRLVAQSILVALNARDEDTPESAKAAKKVWTALNDVGQALSKDLQNSQYMSGFFNNLAQANNVRMTGGNQSVSMTNYQTGYLRRGDSTNIWIDPAVLATVNGGSIVPQNSSGKKSAGGAAYLAGYVPFSIQCNGIDLDFSGVSICPNDRPHLVSWGDFLLNQKDDFITGKGNPSYPAATIPPNTFGASGVTREGTANAFVGAAACAIASSVNVQYQMQIPYGYIAVVNGPSAVVDKTPPTNTAATGLDIFSHALGGTGIAVSSGHNWFCQAHVEDTQSDYKSIAQAPMTGLSEGSQLRNEINAYAMANALYSHSVSEYDSATQKTVSHTVLNDPNSIDTAEREIRSIPRSAKQDTYDLITTWATINGFSQLAKDFLWDYNGGAGIPNKVFSSQNIWDKNGDQVGIAALRTINEPTTVDCSWGNYVSDMGGKKNPCLTMLAAFRKGFQQPGSVASRVDGLDANGDHTGFTDLELLKAKVMEARTSCINVGVAYPEKVPSGMKWFEHGKSYPAPHDNPYNFGVVKSPYEYMQMIDQVSGTCAETTVFEAVLKRCQQIEPGISGTDLKTALLSRTIKLGQTLYLSCDQSRHLVLSDQPPLGYVPGTTVDGVKSPRVSSCGSSYDPIKTLVNTSSGTGDFSLCDIGKGDTDYGTDGNFPGWAWKDSPDCHCTDTVTLTPSSGYNNLLGQVSFTNLCTGGGGFSDPN